MNVLIACEESQVVCNAFRERGHCAFSCDIQECSGGHPEWHIKGNALSLLNGHRIFQTMDGLWHDCVGASNWDLVIAHPPCTHLAVSGARWFPEKQKDFRQQRACVLFMRFALADCKRVCVENPVGIMSSVYEKPTQIIQPWQFGHGEVKATCLWLKGLPLLVPTNIVDGREQRVWKMPPSPDRAKERSKTYPGIAKAMAEQWGIL